ncbi:hypothetical protein ABK040_007815 [Willaertia magna]
MENNIVDQVVLKTGHTIQLIEGNVLDATVDCILFAEISRNIELSGTDLLKRAGSSLQDLVREYVKQNGTLDRSDKVATINLTSAELKVNNVVFAAGPLWKGGKKNEKTILEETIYNCLEEANNKHFTSIAMDALCTDLFGFPNDVCAEAVYQAIGSWCLYRQFAYLNVIKVIIQNNKLDKFKEYFPLAFKDNPSFKTETSSGKPKNLHIKTGSNSDLTDLDEEQKKRKVDDEEETTHKRKGRNEETTIETLLEENDDDEEDEALTSDPLNKKLKGIKKASQSAKNSAWKRNRNEHKFLNKAKKKNIDDISTNITNAPVNIQAEDMSISTSLAMEDYSNMKDEDENNFDMTFL